MITIEELKEENKSLFNVKDLLKIGFDNIVDTTWFCDLAENVVAIDIDEANCKMLADGTKNVKNLDIKTMDASKMSFDDKTFDVIAMVSTMHEIDYEKQMEALSEVLRCLKDDGKIIFIEDDSDSSCNEIFKVFDPTEDHGKRIEITKENVSKFAESNNCKITKLQKSLTKYSYSSIEELDDRILKCWDDIKKPKDDTERQEMITQIHKVLEDHDTLKDLCRINYTWFWIMEKNK